MKKETVRYRIVLDSGEDANEFRKIAQKVPHELYLVNGHHRLNAKSYLGVALARMAWGEIWLEADYDCYYDFERFIRRQEK